MSTERYAKGCTEAEGGKLIEENWQIKIEDGERQLKIARVEKAAAEVLHCAGEAKAEVVEIEQALATNEHVRMWVTLQKFLARYWQFINATSGITNIAAIPLPKEMVRIITTEDLRHQLQLVIGFVYASHAIECVGRIAFEECFNKLLKGSKC